MYGNSKLDLSSKGLQGMKARFRYVRSVRKDLRRKRNGCPLLYMGERVREREALG